MFIYLPNPSDARKNNNRDPVRPLDRVVTRIHHKIAEKLRGKTPSTVLVNINAFNTISWVNGLTYMRFASASALRWAPHIQGIVAQVLSGIRNDCGSADSDLNGVHLRLEGDAGPWLARRAENTMKVVPVNEARVMGWQFYLKHLLTYGMLTPGQPLYLSTGLVKSSSDDAFAATLMETIIENLTSVRSFAAQ